MNSLNDKIAVGVVIPAAGNASRMKGVDKQQLLLGGIPVIVRSIMAFQKRPEVLEIVVVCKEDTMTEIQGFISRYNLTKVVNTVCGGASRQQSVFNGIAQLSHKITHFAIHDGARPFVDENTLDRCFYDVIQHKAVTAAVPVRDTIKKQDENGYIDCTIDRSVLHITQTPQVFEKELYLNAMKKAVDDGIEYTDDCQLCESLGEKVYLTMGSEFNRKITTPEDIVLGEAIAKIMEAERK